MNHTANKRTALGRLMAPGFALALTGTAALAQGAETKGADWSLILGAGAVSEPEFEGSDETEVSALPLFILSYGRWQFGPDRIAVDLFSGASYYGDLHLSYGGGRSADDMESNDLDGLEDIDDGAIIGGEIGYRAGGTRVYMELNRYLDGTEGTTAKLGVAYDRDVSQRFSWSVGASATYADENYMDGYFGVSAAESAASGHARHSASAGFQRYDLSLSARYAFSPSWFVLGALGIGQLTGDAADSPFVRDDTQSSFSVFVGYRF